MAQSYVPQAVQRIHAITVAALAATGSKVPVYLGEPTGADIPDSYVAVMYAGPEQPAVAGGRVRQPHSEHWSEEFDVWVSVSTASGDERAELQLADTETLYTLVVQAVAADRQLDGLLAQPGYAEPGDYQWTVERGGQVCTVTFTVHVLVVWGM